MSVALDATAELEVAQPFAPSTPIERTLLREFAKWFASMLEKYQPDVIVPTGTKGTRLLQAVLDYGRHKLDLPLPVPVLYPPALAYAARNVLASMRVLLFDDATHTGTTRRWGSVSARPAGTGRAAGSTGRTGR